MTSLTNGTSFTTCVGGDLQQQMGPTKKDNRLFMSFSEFMKSSSPASCPLSKHERQTSNLTAETVDTDVSAHYEDEEEEECLFEIYVPKKSVSFASLVSARYTISRRHYTAQEIQRTWYSREEFSDISRQCCKQIAKMERCEKLKDVKYCSRGLEGYVLRGAQMKKQNRNAAYSAVLDKSCDDDFNDSDNAEWIAEQYHSVSSSCQLWARNMALHDRKDAEEYLFEDDDC